MIEIPLPDAQVHPAGETVRSFAACLASATHTPIEQLPLPDADLAGSMAQWRSWLAGRGAGLVPIARPATFTWPGYWIAVLRGDDDPAAGLRSPGSSGPTSAPGSPGSPGSLGSSGPTGATSSQGPTGSSGDEAVAVLLFGTPSGVVLSPQDHRWLGRAAVDLPIREGYVLGALDPRLDLLPARPGPALRGRVELVALAGEKAGPMRTVPAARALAGRGLEGDRYAAKAGTFTPADPRLRGYDLTLVEAEVLDALELPGGRRLGYPDARRNVVTRGIDLNSLVGRRFRVGTVECLGQRMAEPCAHLERLTVSGVLRPLIHRAGLRADVLTDGEIRPGDVVETIDRRS